MKKTFVVIFGLMALMGMMNCFLLEPALAVKEQFSLDQTEDSDCCFLCCSTHHQWVSPLSLDFLPSLFQSADVVPSNLSLYSDPARGSIFHPPLAF